MAYYYFTNAFSEGRASDDCNHGRMRRDFAFIHDVIGAVERLLKVPLTTLSEDRHARAPTRDL